MAKKPEKAYKNLEFLNSSEARMLRILSEYLEPRVRFHKHNVEDTIVFFGSARTLDRKGAEEAFEVAERQFNEMPSEENGKLKSVAERKLKLSQYYEDARSLSRLLTEWSLGLGSDQRRFIVASGGGPGIMEAVNRGASEVPGGVSIGLNISIPFEQEGNPYITDELNFEFHYFFTRKFWFTYLAKAMVIFPGGFGTLDEFFEGLTLIQTHKINKKIPIVLYGESYWKNLINFDALVDNMMIHENDLNLFRFFNSPQEAFEYLRDELTAMYQK
mgnify:CR=1 FL=1